MRKRASKDDGPYVVYSILFLGRVSTCMVAATPTRGLSSNFEYSCGHVFSRSLFSIMTSILNILLLSYQLRIANAAPCEIADKIPESPERARSSVLLKQYVVVGASVLDAWCMYSLRVSSFIAGTSDVTRDIALVYGFPSVWS